MNYEESWKRARSSIAGATRRLIGSEDKTPIEVTPIEKPPEATAKKKPAPPLMQFSIHQYIQLIGNVWPWTQQSSDFWQIVIKVAWLIHLIESNEEISVAIRATDPDERAALIRSWLGES